MSDETLLTVRIPRRDLENFKTACQVSGNTMAHIVRRAVQEYTQSHRPQAINHRAKRA